MCITTAHVISVILDVLSWIMEHASELQGNFHFKFCMWSAGIHENVVCAYAWY